MSLNNGTDSIFIFKHYKRFEKDLLPLYIKKQQQQQGDLTNILLSFVKLQSVHWSMYVSK